MSLSLNDLDKSTTKKTARRTNSRTTCNSEEAPPKKVVRPWSDKSLGHKGQAINAGEAAVNEEWLNLHEEALLWIDFSADARLARIESALERFEEFVMAHSKGPLAGLSKLKFVTGRLLEIIEKQKNRD